MRYAIVSDIHANLAAWNTVLADIADAKADTIICLGDVVGYGPDPVAVLESVYRVVHVTLMGNHDAAVCGKLDPEVFSARAKGAVVLHRSLISAKGLEWLSHRPLVLTGPGFRCAHGDFSEPAAFHYIIEPREALPSWQATTEQLLFVGHTHLPGIYVVGASGAPHFVESCDFQLEEGKRYIVNPGSVGYPRVGDCRSSYCLYDSASKSLSFRSVPFDCEGYRARVLAAGLEDDPWLVSKASERHLPTLRERLCFERPLARSEYARDVRQHASLAARRLRRHLALLAAFLLAAACAAALAAYRAGRDAAGGGLALAVPNHDLEPLVAFPLAPPDKNLLPEIPPALGDGGRLDGWRYALEERGRQALATGLRDGALTLRITHDGERRLELESPLINLAGTGLQALRLSARIHKLDGFTGSVLFRLVTYEAGPGDALRQAASESYEARSVKRGGETTATLSRKIELSRRVTHVRLRVEADFAGTLELDRPQLTAEAVRGRAAAPVAEKASEP